MDSTVSRKGRLQFLVIAALLLLLPFGWYYFVYIPSEKADLTERNFRLLGVTSQQIQARIENLHGSWKQMTRESELIKVCEGEKTDLAECLKQKINLIWGIEKNSTKVEHRGDSSSFEIKRERDTVTAYFSQYLGEGWHVTAKSNIGSLLTPIVSRPEFDDVLVVQPKDGQQDGGEVVFQRESGGTQILTLLLSVEKNQQGKESKESQENRLVEVELTGALYKVFVQPLQLSFLRMTRLKNGSGLSVGSFVLIISSQKVSRLLLRSCLVLFF